MSRLMVVVTSAALACCLNAVAQTRDEFVKPDAFGYQSNAFCPVQFVDISASGTPLAMSDTDDGGAAVILSQAFSFYGSELAEVVVSTNGYIAFAEGLGQDDGGDFSNDCELPAIPDQGPGVSQRILLLHDDLEAVDGSSSVAEQYFTDCPRPSDSLTIEACTIFQWTGWRVRGTSGNFSTQALLYHDSGDVVIQYSDLTAADSLNATIGIQTSDSAAMLSCNRTAPTVDSVCFALGVDSPPSALADAMTVVEGGVSAVLDGGANSVKANDTDPEDTIPAGDVTLDMGTVFGSLVLNADGTFSYSHDGSETTSDSFSYTVADSSGNVSNIAAVSITITPQNDQPVAVEDRATVVRGGMTTALDDGSISLRSNDTDAEDGTPAGEVTLLAMPSNGLLMLASDGSFEYVHDGGTATSDSFSYRVADGDGALSSPGTVRITVIAPPVELLFSDGFESR